MACLRTVFYASYDDGLNNTHASRAFWTKSADREAIKTYIHSPDDD
jgi:hypothetical protein